VANRFWHAEGPEQNRSYPICPGPGGSSGLANGTVDRPRAAEVRMGTRPLATATSTLITNWDHLLSVVMPTLVHSQDARK